MADPKSDSLMKELGKLFEESPEESSNSKVSEANEGVSEQSTESSGGSEPEQEKETSEETTEDATSGKDTGLSDDTLIDIKGEKVSLGELKAGYFRHADYTRKTQALAKERKEWEAKKAEEETKLAAERQKALYPAELAELEEYRRIDQIISSDPQRAEAFKRLWKSANPEGSVETQSNIPTRTELPSEVVEKLNKLDKILEEQAQKEEQAQIDKEMAEVRQLLGVETIPDGLLSEFLEYAEKLQDQVEGIIPLPAVARMFPKFHDMLVEKSIKARESARQKAEEKRAKNTKVIKGTKPSRTGAQLSGEDELMDAIERALAGEEI